MMEKLKNVPVLRFPEFTDEFHLQPFGSVGEIIGGGTPETAVDKYWNGSIHWFTPTELKSKYLAESRRQITEAGLKSSSAKLLPIGTLLISTRATVGDISIADVECTTNQGFQSMVVNEHNFNEYVYYWLINNKHQLLKKASGSTFLEINKTELSKLAIFLPSLIEQQKIASFLTVVDEKIQQLSKKKALLEQYKKGVMQQLFSQQLRFKDDQGNTYPDWEEKTMREIAKFYSGGTPTTGKAEYYDGEIPFIKSGEINALITAQTITNSGLVNSSAKMVEIGDILYALYGATSGEVAISKIKGAINQAVLCIKSEHNSYFLMSFLRLNKQAIIGTYLQGGQGNLSAEIVKSIGIRIPCIAEQNKIASFLSAIDNKIDSTIQQIEQTRQFKKGLLQQMFI